METVWPGKSKIFTMWPFSENVVDLWFKRLTKPTFTQICKQSEKNLLKNVMLEGVGWLKSFAKEISAFHLESDI